MQIIFLKLRENLFAIIICIAIYLLYILYCGNGSAHALGMLPHALRMAPSMARHGISCDIIGTLHSVYSTIILSLKSLQGRRVSPPCLRGED